LAGEKFKVLGEKHGEVLRFSTENPHMDYSGNDPGTHLCEIVSNLLRFATTTGHNKYRDQGIRNK
jgi:hypothetical protein